MNQVLITIGVILNATLMYTPPLLFAALGSCFSEKSGVVNIGLEGMIVIGAFTGAAVGHFVDAPWLAFLCAGLAGGLLALLHAFATVTCQADQTISGTAINFLASGLSVYICFLLFRTSETMPVKSKLPRIFNDLFVWLGNNLPEGAAKLFRQNGFFDLVFNTYASAYIAFLLVIVVWYVFYRTRFGLRLRAVGEHPRAADTLGVNVTLVRYLCVILSGILAGFWRPFPRSDPRSSSVRALSPSRLLSSATSSRRARCSAASFSVSATVCAWCWAPTRRFRSRCSKRRSTSPSP